MNHKHRLRVSRTTIRTLDVTDLAVAGGTGIPPGPTFSCISCATEGLTGCGGSAGEDCTVHTRVELTL